MEYIEEKYHHQTRINNGKSCTCNYFIIVVILFVIINLASGNFEI